MKIRSSEIKRFAVATGIAVSGIGASATLIPANALTFNFTSASSAVTSDVSNGFIAAGNLWSSLLDDNVTINITIDYKALGENTLGEAGTYISAVSYQDFYNQLKTDRTSLTDTSAVDSLSNSTSFNRLINLTKNNPNTNGDPYINSSNDVVLSTANAKALGFTSSNTVDAEISFSSGSPWDFNPNDGIDNNKYDFVGVAIHEIGHSLGFISAVDSLKFYNGSLDDTDRKLDVYALDLFRHSTTTRDRNALNSSLKAIDFTVSSTDKYFSIDGGVTKIASFETGLGYQASHWLDNKGIGAMDPTSGNGERQAITQNDLQALDAIGWNRSANSFSSNRFLSSTAVPEPSDYLGTFIFAAFGVKMIVKRRRDLAKSVEAESAREG